MYVSCNCKIDIKGNLLIVELIRLRFVTVTNLCIFIKYIMNTYLKYDLL